MDWLTWPAAFVIVGVSFAALLSAAVAFGAWLFYRLEQQFLHEEREIHDWAKDRSTRRTHGPI